MKNGKDVVLKMRKNQGNIAKKEQKRINQCRVKNGIYSMQGLKK